MGLYNLRSNLDLLIQMKTYSYAVMFIGLIFDILLFIFIFVSCLLIYSLLLISVETKTFEIGVMRLVGLTKFGFIGLILTQATFFVLPSVILGFLLALPTIWGIYALLFSDDLGYFPSVLPSSSASLQALAIGVLIPFLSSIIPIQRALSKSLTDSLNTQRSKQSGVLVTLTDNESKIVVPYILFGSVCVTFGMAVYYFLPLGLMNQNIGVILWVFFAIFIGMMSGLTLLVTNLRGLLEVVLVYALFFWEKKSIRALLLKNLASHKQRNFMTSIIYSLSLGIIIFLLVSANLQIQAISAKTTIQDADVYLKDVRANQTDWILLQYQDSIKDFAYVSKRLKNY